VSWRACGGRATVAGSADDAAVLDTLGLNTDGRSQAHLARQPAFAAHCEEATMFSPSKIVGRTAEQIKDFDGLFGADH